MDLQWICIIWVIKKNKLAFELGSSVLPRLTSNSWVQVVHLLQPPKVAAHHCTPINIFLFKRLPVSVPTMMVNEMISDLKGKQFSTWLRCLPGFWTFVREYDFCYPSVWSLSINMSTEYMALGPRQGTPLESAVAHAQHLPIQEKGCLSAQFDQLATLVGLFNRM